MIRTNPGVTRRDGDCEVMSKPVVTLDQQSTFRLIRLGVPSGAKVMIASNRGETLDTLRAELAHAAA